MQPTGSQGTFLLQPYWKWQVERPWDQNGKTVIESENGTLILWRKQNEKFGKGMDEEALKGRVKWSLRNENCNAEKDCHMSLTDQNTQVKEAVYQTDHLPLNTFISYFCVPIPSSTHPNLLTHRGHVLSW